MSQGANELGGESSIVQERISQGAKQQRGENARHLAVCDLRWAQTDKSAQVTITMYIIIIS